MGHEKKVNLKKIELTTREKDDKPKTHIGQALELIKNKGKKERRPSLTRLENWRESTGKN